MLLIEVRHIRNLFVREHHFYGRKCLLSGCIIVEETDDLVVQSEVVRCPVQIGYRVQDNDITGRAKGRLQNLPGEEVEEAFKDQN